MGKEQKNSLSLLIEYKAKLIKWGIVAVIIIAASLAIFFKGQSRAEKKYEDLVAELTTEKRS